MASADRPGGAQGSPDHFSGPAEFAAALLAARREAEWEKHFFGKISADGLRRLILMAYYASQTPNEGRLPRLTLLVPANAEEVNLLVSLREALTVPALRRIGPTLASQDHALVVREQDQALRMTGITALRGLLTEMSIGDPASRPSDRPKGLFVDISGPGELRAGEHRTHRLRAGALHEETSFVWHPWFRAWYEEAAGALFGWTPRSRPADDGWPVEPGFVLANVWLRLLRKAGDLHHGGCFVILPDPAAAPIRPTFAVGGSDLVAALRDWCAAVRRGNLAGLEFLTPGETRRRLLLRERLLAAVDATAHLSATDGCVVLNRRLEVQSFGSMIEVPGAGSEAPCFAGDSSDPLDDDTLRSFGARSRSAVQLGRACPGAMAFVLSQDGDLRIVVRAGDAVRVYENATYW